MVGALEIVPDLRKKRLIELDARPGVGKLLGRRGRDQTEFGLGLGEHDHDLDPTGGQRGIVEECAQFGRGPRTSIDG